MDIIGLDLHKRESQVCVLTEAGEIRERRGALRRLPVGVGAPVEAAPGGAEELEGLGPAMVAWSD